MIKLRCSQLPTANECPASAHAVGGEIRINYDSDAAKLGTAVHALAARIVRGEQQFDIAAEAHGAGVDPDELRYLFSQARAWWTEPKIHNLDGSLTPPLSEWCENWRAEATWDSAELSGHPDISGLLIASPHTAVIVDWKSGRMTDTDYEAQLRGLARLAQSELSAATVIAIIIWLRENTFQIWTLNPREAAAWFDDLHSRVNNWDGATFNPGEHCEFCPRYHSCPARTARSSAALQLVMHNPDLLITDETIRQSGVEWYQAASEAERLAVAIKDAIKSAHRRGVTVSGNGYELVAGEPPDEINSAAAAPILLRAFKPEQIIGELRVTKSAVAALAKIQGVRGANKALLDDLRVAGAIMPGAPRITLRKIKSQITGEVENG